MCVTRVYSVLNLRLDLHSKCDFKPYVRCMVYKRDIFRVFEVKQGAYCVSKGGMWYNKGDKLQEKAIIET